MARAGTRVAIGLFGAWQLAMFLVILQRITEFGVGALADLWYAALMDGVFAWFLAKQVERRARGEIQELLTIDLLESVYPMLASFVAHFAALFTVYAGAGIPLGVPAWSDVLRQLFVVTPTETFVWIFFLPRVLPDIAGIPSWVWSSVSFAGYHVFAYGADLGAMALAGILNGVWYMLYEGRAKYRFLGLPFVWMSHFSLNVFGLAAKGAALALLILRALGIA